MLFRFPGRRLCNSPVLDYVLNLFIGESRKDEIRLVRA